MPKLHLCSTFTKMSVKNLRHSDILRKSTPFLIENIYDVHEILDHLLASEVMSWDEKDDISCQETRRKRMEMLLNFLRVKDQRTFDIFHEALTYSGNGFVREELERIATQLEEERATESGEGSFVILFIDKITMYTGCPVKKESSVKSTLQF